MAVLTREQLIDRLKNAELRTEVVEVPEWGDSVTLRELSADELMSLALPFANADNMMVDGATMLRIVAYALDLGEDGADLLKTQTAVVMRLAPKVLALSGLSGDAAKND